MLIGISNARTKGLFAGFWLAITLYPNALAYAAEAPKSNAPTAPRNAGPERGSAAPSGAKAADATAAVTSPTSTAEISKSIWPGITIADQVRVREKPSLEAKSVGYL